MQQILNYFAGLDLYGWLEILAMVVGIYYVYLEIRKTRLLWYVCILTSILNIFVYWHNNYLSMTLIQFYYIATAIYGIYSFTKIKKEAIEIYGEERNPTGQKVAIRRFNWKTGGIALALGVAVFFLLVPFLKHYAAAHGTLLFPSQPYWDAFIAVGSSIARNTDTGTYTHVGPEIGVASTKAFTGQVCVLTMLALAIGDAKGSISHEEYQKVIDELQVIPDKIERILAQNSQIETLSKIFTYAHNFLYLGRKWNFPVALEGALKLKEISYIHAEGYPAAEMKHGPIALIDKEMPVVFIATHHQLLEKIISNMQEVKSRNGRIIAIITEGDEVVKKIVSEYIEVPDTIACLAPLLSVIPLQLLAYHIAVQKGLDVDQPRNLAKSVTVE